MVGLPITNLGLLLLATVLGRLSTNRGGKIKFQLLNTRRYQISPPAKIIQEKFRQHFRIIMLAHVLESFTHPLVLKVLPRVHREKVEGLGAFRRGLRVQPPKYM